MRRLLTLVALVLLAAMASPHVAWSARRAHGASACSRSGPAGLRFYRAPGRTFGRLSWRPARGAAPGSRYRVLRNGKVVGQTLAHSMRVNVALGRRYRLRVVPVSSAGRPLRCAARTLRISTAYRAPGAPGFPQARTTGTTVTLSWQPAAAGDARIVGYRVLRNRAVYGQTRRRSMHVRVASGRTYTFTVIAVDGNGRLSRPSAPVRLLVGHHAPSAPGSVQGSAVSSTTVSLSWQPSRRVQGRIAGYRVLRDGAPIGQYAATSATVSNLSPSRAYAFTVVAVDGLGYVSAASAPVMVRTAAPGAPSVPASLLAAPLNDTTVALSWQPSQAAQGRIAGYRVMRNGTVIGEFGTTTINVTNLAPSTTYTFTVTAVDSLGDQSAPSPPATVRTANPTPTTGHVYAFLLADTDASFQDFQSHYQEIGTISPTYYDCDPAGNLTGANVPLITQWAQARGVHVLPRFNCQRSAVIDEILNNATMREQWLNAIVSDANAGGYDGVTIDFEAGYATDRDAYTSFITDLAAQLHAVGKSLVVAVSAKTADVQNSPRSTFFDYNALSAQADALFVMAWGIHWATSAPGAQDDMTWESQVVSYIASLPRVNKYILGMQLYAMDWANGGGTANPATSYYYAAATALAASLGVAPAYSSSADAWTFSYSDASGAPHVVWYTNAATEGDRIAMAHANGFGGVGVWRLGQEDQTLWNNPLLTGSW